MPEGWEGLASRLIPRLARFGYRNSPWAVDVGASSIVGSGPPTTEWTVGAWPTHPLPPHQTWTGVRSTLQTPLSRWQTSVGAPTSPAYPHCLLRAHCFALVLAGHRKEGYGLAFNSKKEGLLASGSDDSLVCVWNIAATLVRGQKEMTPLVSFTGHTDVVEVCRSGWCCAECPRSSTHVRQPVWSGPHNPQPECFPLIRGQSRSGPPHRPDVSAQEPRGSFTKATPKATPSMSLRTNSFAFETFSLVLLSWNGAQPGRGGCCTRLICDTGCVTESPGNVASPQMQFSPTIAETCGSCGVSLRHRTALRCTRSFDPLIRDPKLARFSSRVVVNTCPPPHPAPARPCLRTAPSSGHRFCGQEREVLFVHRL